MEWCEANHIDYVFGLPGSKPLAKKIDEAADAVRTERALSNKPVVRGYAETRHKAKSWSRERRAVARIEATPLGLDTVSSSPTSNTARRNGFTPASIARAGRPRTSSSCTRRSSLPIERPVVPPIANQVRLALHTAAYWLMLTVRDAIPKPRDLANAEFSTLRLRLIKIAARVIETASRVRLAFAAGCPEADLFRGLPGALAPLGP